MLRPQTSGRAVRPKPVNPDCLTPPELAQLRGLSFQPLNSMSAAADVDNDAARVGDDVQAIGAVIHRDRITVRLHAVRRRQAVGVHFSDPLTNQNLILLGGARTLLVRFTGDGIVRRRPWRRRGHRLARGDKQCGKTHGGKAFHADFSQRPEVVCFQ